MHCSAGVGRTGTFVTSLILLSSQLFQSTIEDEFFLRDFLDESFQYLSHDTLVSMLAVSFDFLCEDLGSMLPFSSALYIQALNPL